MTTQTRHLAVHVDSGDTLDVRQFAVEQRISSLFEITLTAHCENADLAFEAVLGQPARFHVRGGPTSTREWTGICRDIRQVAVEETGHSTYELTIVPTLWLLTQRRNHRMFQQLSELDIAGALLAEWGIEHELRITGTYRPREYRVQYGESDYAFLCRMLEDAGISFFFEQTDGGTRLVLADAPQLGAARPSITFRDNPTRAPDREHVTKLHVGQRVRPGRYTLRDHDPRIPPTFPLLAGAEGGLPGVEARLERFHYVPGAFSFGTDQGDDMPHGDDRGKTRTDEREAQSLAKKRLDAKRSSATTCSFETNVADLAPGVVLSILDHPRSDVVKHPLLVIASSLAGDSHGEWAHRCEARRADVPYRPALSTPKPRASGVESATVVGPPGEEIHTDELGRVRVHFHWDRESRMDHRSSCWIHTSQPWGGAGFGGSNLPRIGQEVLVDFIGGDPDKPVITGRVYTGLQKTPYSLPGNKTQSGWKSQSSPGGGGYNEIMFEDAAGVELVRMQAQKDLHKLVKNDENVIIGNNRTKLVQVDDALTVGNSRTKVVQVDENVTIGNNHTQLVQVDQALTVGNNRTKAVQNDENVTIGNNHTRSVQNDESVTIGNNHTRNVQSNESVTVGSDHTRQVGGSEAATIGQDLVHTVMANAREVTGLMKNITVGISRATQVGTIDHTMVGESHVVMVSPVGEGLDFDALTRSVMQENSIELATTEGANITWKNATLTLDANKPADKSATIKMDGDQIEIDMNATATITLKDNKVSLTTKDGASLVLDGANVSIKAGKGGTITIEGDPMVEINPHQG